MQVTDKSITGALEWIKAIAGETSPPGPLSVRGEGEHEAQANALNGRSSSNALHDSIETLTPREMSIATQILKEIEARLMFLLNIGLDYLTLSRMAATLSGGEAQRIRLATQIGSGLMGVLYVCDEPSIGLHPADDHRLIQTLKRLRDLGNTVLIVEHDEAIMRESDYIVDLGPGAGEHGGHIVAIGPVEDIMRSQDSITGAYLSGRRTIPRAGKEAQGYWQEHHHQGRESEQPQKRGRKDSAWDARVHYGRVRFRQKHADIRNPV